MSTTEKKESKSENIVTLILCAVILSFTIAGTIFLYWGYKVTNNMSDDGKGVYYSSSNPDIKDSIIKPIGPVIKEKLNYAILFGVVCGISFAYPLTDFLKKIKKKDDEIEELGYKLWELQKKDQNIKIINPKQDKD